MEREILGQRFVTDDYARGVCADVADAAFHAAGHIDQAFILVIGVVQRFQLSVLLQRFGQRNVFSLKLAWHRLCHTVHFDQGDVHHSPNIPDSATGCHGPKGDNLGHLISAIFLVAIFHHLCPAVIREIKVDIGH